MDKCAEKVRKKYIGLRKKNSQEDRKIANNNIFELLKNDSDIQKAKNIMVYISTEYEAATAQIIKYFFKQLKNVYAPVMEDKEIKIVKIDEKTVFIENNLGIKEPLKKRKYVDCKILDVVLVPGVCWTKKGERLGRGGGHYDRFLKKFSDNIYGKSIGICYGSQLAVKIPQNENDVKVDKIICDGKAKNE